MLGRRKFHRKSESRSISQPSLSVGVCWGIVALVFFAVGSGYRDGFDGAWPLYIQALKLGHAQAFFSPLGLSLGVLLGLFAMAALLFAYLGGKIFAHAVDCWRGAPMRTRRTFS